MLVCIHVRGRVTEHRMSVLFSPFFFDCFPSVGRLRGGTPIITDEGSGTEHSDKLGSVTERHTANSFNY